jgi:alpha-glucosidase
MKLTAAFALTTFLLNGIAAGAAPTPITLTEGTNQLQVVVLADDVVRVRIGPGGKFANDGNPEYVVIKPDASWPSCAVVFSNLPGRAVVDTGTLKLEFTKNPLTLSVSDAAGQRLFSDYRIDFTQPKAMFTLNSREHIYGFGGKRGPLDKRGQFMDIWNKDAFASEGDACYKNVPFYMSSRGYGFYLHNWWRSSFDAGHSVKNRMRITAEGGEMDFYIFHGPSYKRILNLYTELTGRPALQPLWFFGYHQGKASYKTPDDARRVAQELRQRRLPCNAIYYDDVNSRVTTEDFIHEVRDKWHIRLTFGLGNPMVSFGRSDYKALESHGGLLVNSNGATMHYVTDETRSDVANVDFFSDAASDLFFDLVWRPAIEHGGDPGMVDFGELQYVPDPAHVYFPSIHRSVREMHNIYGLVYAEQLINRAASVAAAKRHQGRKVSMLRSGTAGSQRVGWTTTGDSMPTFQNFRAQLRGLLSLTMSGFSHVGCDIGGWDSKGPDLLYARWFEEGMFNPFAWAHGQGDHEPWVHGPIVEGICRAALERRYQMLPYIYSLNYEASQTGAPAMRSLILETEEDSLAGVDDEFFLGPWLLVAPVMTGRSARDIRLPAGDWIEIQGGKVYAGSQTLRHYKAPLDTIPVFVRAGAIIPMGPVMQYTGEKPLDPLTLDIYPKGHSSFTIYEDDGESLDYEKGGFVTTTVESVATTTNTVVTLHARDIHGGGYKPVPRDCLLHMHVRNATAKSVLCNGIPLARLKDVTAGLTGWTQNEDQIWIRFKDTGREMRIAIGL